MSDTKPLVENEEEPITEIAQTVSHDDSISSNIEDGVPSDARLQVTLTETLSETKLPAVVETGPSPGQSDTDQISSYPPTDSPGNEKPGSDLSIPPPQAGTSQSGIDSPSVLSSIGQPSEHQPPSHTDVTTPSEVTEQQTAVTINEQSEAKRIFISSHTEYSVLSLLFFIPLGIVAVYHSIKTSRYKGKHKTEEAINSSRRAYRWAAVATFTGPLLGIVVVVVLAWFNIFTPSEKKLPGPIANR